jgi:hypothetical protein
VHTAVWVDWCAQWYGVRGSLVGRVVAACADGGWWCAGWMVIAGAHRFSHGLSRVGGSRAAETGLGGNSLICLEFRRTARRWAREHTPHLAVMHTPRVCAPVPKAVPTCRRARASRDTGVVAAWFGRTLPSSHWVVFGCEPMVLTNHIGVSAASPSEVGQSAGNVFKLLQRYLRYAESHTRAGPPRNIEKSSSRDFAPRRW